MLMRKGEPERVTYNLVFSAVETVQKNKPTTTYINLP